MARARSDERERRLLLARPVQGELHVVAGGVAELLAEVAQREVGKVEGALAGQREVCGQRGVRGQSIQNESVRCQRVHGSLGVVQRLGAVRRREPVAEGALVVRGSARPGRGRRRCRRARRSRCRSPGPCRAPGAVQSKPHPFGGLVFLEPLRRPRRGRGRTRRPRIPRWRPRRSALPRPRPRGRWRRRAGRRGTSGTGGRAARGTGGCRRAGGSCRGSTARVRGRPGSRRWSRPAGRGRAWSAGGCAARCRGSRAGRRPPCP